MVKTGRGLIDHGTLGVSNKRLDELSRITMVLEIFLV